MTYGPIFAFLVFAAGYFAFLVLASLGGLFLPTLGQLVGFVALPLLLLKFQGHSIADAISLRIPKKMYWLIAVLLGVSFWVPASLLASLFSNIPGQEQAIEQLEHQISAVPFGVLLITAALVPAICEEILLRGVLLRPFIPDRKKLGIVVSALLFAVLHITLVRIPPTFVMGLLLAYLTVRSRSIFPAMLFHAIHNLTVLSISRLGSPETNVLSWFVLGVLPCFILGGALLVRKERA